MPLCYGDSVADNKVFVFDSDTKAVFKQIPSNGLVLEASGFKRSGLTGPRPQTVFEGSWVTAVIGTHKALDMSLVRFGRVIAIATRGADGKELTPTHVAAMMFEPDYGSAAIWLLSVDDILHVIPKHSALIRWMTSSECSFRNLDLICKLTHRELFSEKNLESWFSDGRLHAPRNLAYRRSVFIEKSEMGSLVYVVQAVADFERWLHQLGVHHLKCVCCEQLKEPHQRFIDLVDKFMRNYLHLEHEVALVQDHAKWLDRLRVSSK